MSALFLRSERTGAAWQVWPQPEEVPPGAVQETGSYLFELQNSPEAPTAALLIDDRPLEALRAAAADQAHWRWLPGFHAGTVEAELRLQGQPPRRFEVVTDPDRRKLTRDAFDAMVREILDDSFALFSLSSFRKAVGHGSGSRPPPVARLEFLRSRVDELSAIVESIARSPRRRLAAEERVLPYHRASRATGLEILRSFHSGRLRRESVVPSRLPAGLQGFLPEQIRLRQHRSSLDLPEHRQMAACLRAWSAWLSSTAGLLERSRKMSDDEQQQTASVWAARCRRLSHRIGRLAEAAPFAEAGEAPPQLVLSALFRHDPLYRRFYRLWQDMNLGIAAVFGDFLNLPLARTFELYELWCFLRLVRAGAEAFGPEGLEIRDLFISDAAGGVTLATGAVTVPVGSGWKLCFQKQYREFWREADGRGSYSRTMTPDVVMARDAGEADTGRLIVLDAKYRIDDGLNDALSSIHTYRDALVREAASGGVEEIVTAAYLLTPHMPVTRDDYRATPMPGRLFHPDYRRGFRFGAVTLQPGMSVEEIAAALRLIVADAGAG
ncbi:DUF2357 domain-containing protein [Pseudoroseomonas ludipueritiae]|uniref:DUF2357 domain-containing protein n=1 Tax=Pseudoroseomonas ludipueritiae TaxID=198093 RepID=A0ABR7R2Y7_9PROT|nr:DUF2357 domain-containing protein [Pseudoroseomonas ludipueritiae]MBC9176120.1 DUF2357 domain-containing protein [Pseudoroseomonas ludipueritiae]